jgi:hypothetical protein
MENKMRDLKPLFWILCGSCMVASLLGYFADMPPMSWGGLGFIGGVLFIIGLGDLP